MKDHRVLILGVSGMLGNALYRFFLQLDSYHVLGLSRGDVSGLMPMNHRCKLLSGLDVEDLAAFRVTAAAFAPTVVINCVGLIKQDPGSENRLEAIRLNAMLPHVLAKEAKQLGARFIHVSTDCVFDGRKGNYREDDVADATDVYGRTKYLGEVHDQHSITLRTSIIGHELTTKRGLVDWFLNQRGTIKGYRKAIFSGVPTVELARIIYEHVLPIDRLSGLYHVAGPAIDKCSLLQIIREEYGVTTTIVPDDMVVIDRSLNGGCFSDETGYVPKAWSELVHSMRCFQEES